MKVKLLESNQINNTHQVCITTCVDDSGYARYDVIIDTNENIDIIINSNNNHEIEPLGILVFLDDETRVNDISSGFEEAVNHYDTFKIQHKYKYLNMYHRLVHKNSIINGTQLLQYFMGYCTKNLNYTLLTSHETNQVSVIQRLLKNEFGFVHKHEKKQREEKNRSTVEAENIYGFFEQDMIIDKNNNPINFQLKRRI